MIRSIQIFSLSLLLGCSQYHRVLNKGTLDQRYKMATALYEQQKYEKSLRLFEMIIPYFEGKYQMERIQYMVAQSNFNLGYYPVAGYYFERFMINFPNSSKQEEAFYMSCKSYFLASPKYSVDQEQTYEALASLQKYINTYPNSKRKSSVNSMVKELQNKLQKKYFEIAKQYYTIGDYSAAITAFDYFLSKYLGTSYKEKALYYKFKSSYALAVNSALRKQEQRVKNTFRVFEKFKKNFPESDYLQELDKMLQGLKKI